MRTRLRSKVTLLFIVCAALLAVAGTAMALTTDTSGNTAPAPTIQSDQEDYPPGATVTLTGSNWQPGESVHINVNDDVGQTWSRDVDVSADASGQVQDQFQLPDWFVATYKVTATGAQSGVATTTFTDGNVKARTNASGFTYQLNWSQYDGTSANPNANCTGSTPSSTGSEPSVGFSGGAQFSQGVPKDSSIVLKAADTASNGFVFTGWTGETASDTFLARTDAHEICVTGDFTGNRTYVANYETSVAPTLTRNNATVAVNEGQTAANTGTWADANELDTVTLSASVGTVTKNANGTWSWSYATTDGPDQSQNVTITATDNHNKSSTTTFALTVNNVPPTAVNDNPAAVAEGQAVTLNVLANDTDPAGSNDPLSVTNKTNGQNGTVNCNPNGSCTYTPNDPDFFGTDSFTYTVSDGDGGTSVGTVNITITAVNDPPVAVDDTATTAEDTNLVINNANSLAANDQKGPNESGQTLTVDQVSNPTHGTVSLQNGQITFTPEANYSGPASFDYQVCDDGQTNGQPDHKCDTGTVNITVTAVNDPPAAVDDTATTAEDTNLVISDLSTLTNNDSAGPANENDQTLSVTDVSNAQHGQVSLQNGQITFTPDAEYSGPASFDYQVCDDGQTNGQPDHKCDTGTVNITVNPVNDVPVPVDNVYTTLEDTPLTEGAPGLLGNDTDVEQDTLHVADGNADTADGISPVSGPANGTVELHEDGSFTYTPNLNFNGEDTFTYRVCDNGSPEPQCSVQTATVNVTIEAVNDVPVAVADSYQTNEDTPLTISAQAGVLSNDSDIDGDPLEAVLISGPSNGTLTLNADGSFTYTPNANFNGEDTFTYKAVDPSDAQASATVTVTIQAVNDGPVAVDDSVTTAEDTPAIINVVGNDTDVDGDTLTVVAGSLSTPAHGTAELITSGTDAGKVRYTPAADYNGPDSFTYTVSDGNGGTAQGTVNITVTSVNDNPVITAVSNSGPVNEGSAATIKVTATDQDSPAADLRYSFDCDNNNAFELGPQPADNANCTFADNGTYKVNVNVTDGAGGSATGSTSVVVNNVAPTVTSITPSAQNVLAGSVNSVTFTGTASDPSSVDLTARLFWRWATDSNAYSTYSNAATANTYKASFSTCGLHTVSAQAKDKDGGESATKTVNYANVYNGSFKPPLVDGTVNTVQKGQVIPVKISVGCGTTNLTGLTPQIQLLNGNISPETEAGSTPVTTTSVSSADTNQTMRPVDGGYIYNLLVPSNATANQEFTIRVNPFGGTDYAATGMYVVIKIRK